jgi:hypothetical protein
VREPRQGVHVAALQLLDLAVREEELGERMHHRERLEHLDVRRVAIFRSLAAGKLEPLEQDLRHLAWRSDVERHAGHS